MNPAIESPAKAIECLQDVASGYSFDLAVDVLRRTRIFHTRSDVFDAVMALRAAAGEEWQQVRDWVEVLDKVDAVAFAVRCGLTRKARPGEINYGTAAKPLEPEVAGLNGEHLMEQVEVVRDGADFLVQVRVRQRG